MTVYHAGSNKCFEYTNPAGVGYGDTYLSPDSGDERVFVRANLTDPTTNERISVTDQIWVHGSQALDWFSSNNGWYWQVYNSAGTPVVKLNKEDSGATTTCQYWNGSAWIVMGTCLVSPDGLGVFTYDVRMVIHPTAGRLEFYVNNEYVDSVVNINTSNWVNFHEMRWKRTNRGTSVYDHVISSENTIGWVLKYATINGNGSNQDWIGTYTDINEVGAPNDATQIKTNDVGAKATYTHSTFTATPVGNAVKAVLLGARIRNDGSDVNAQNVRPMLRKISTSTDYVKADGVFYPYSGFDARVAIYENDPSTGLPWTSSTAVNDFEVGFQATDKDGNIV